MKLLRLDGKVLAVLLAALAIRFLLFTGIMDRPRVMLQPDSGMYISLARGLVDHGRFCYQIRPDQAAVDRMPGYPLAIAAFLWVFGGSLLPLVVFQIILDSLSCAVLYHVAESFQKGWGLPCGILAALNVNMITYAHFILNDSIFLFCFLVLLLVMLRLLRDPSWRGYAILGAGMGLTVYIRSVIIYLPIFLGPFFFMHQFLCRKTRLLVAAARVIIMVLAFSVILSPWLARNYAHYGRFKLASQEGEHFLQYILPFVWQYSRGIPFIEGLKQANRDFSERMKTEGVRIEKLDPFELSDLQVRTATDYLRQEPKSAILKAWIVGMAKNLFSPALVDMSNLLDIKRPHFFYTEGVTPFERARNFIRSSGGLFGTALLVGLFLTALFRVIQVGGCIHTIRRNLWTGGLLTLIVAYFLLLSGPVGYAKYRLPFEPVLILWLIAGISSLAQFYGTRLRTFRAGTADN